MPFYKKKKKLETSGIFVWHPSGSGKLFKLFYRPIKDFVKVQQLFKTFYRSFNDFSIKFSLIKLLRGKFQSFNKNFIDFEDAAEMIIQINKQTFKDKSNFEIIRQTKSLHCDCWSQIRKYLCGWIDCMQREFGDWFINFVCEGH